MTKDTIRDRISLHLLATRLSLSQSTSTIRMKYK